MPPSSQAAYQSLQAYKPRSSQDVLTEAQNKYDIPNLGNRVSSMRSVVGNLQSSLEAVDPSVTGRTTGSFVTEGQRQALVNREQAPILTNLGKQQTALGQSESAYNEASGLATQLSNSLLNDDRQSYQRLLDQYNAAVAIENEQRRREEADRQFKLDQEKQAEAIRASRASTAASPTFTPPGSGSLTVNTGQKTNKVQQDAYNDVYTRIQKQNDQQLMSDFLATVSSAKWGNERDLAKLQIYRALRPDLFKGKYRWEK